MAAAAEQRLVVARVAGKMALLAETGVKNSANHWID
jgi:hypothetical protein